MDEYICRCERCGQLLKVDFERGNKFRCKCGNIIEYIDFKDVEEDNKMEGNNEN